MQRLLDRLTNDLLLKVTALGLAFLLWSLVKTDTRVPITEIPIQVVNQDPGWILAGPPEPATVQVTFSGPVRELFRVAAERPSVLVPIDDVSDTLEVVLLHTNWVALGNQLGNTRVEDIRPTAIRLRFDRVSTKTIPVASRLIGSPVNGYALAGRPLLDPATVWVSGASRRLEAIDSVRLPAIDLTERMRTDTLTLVIDTTGLGVIMTPREVRVVLPIRRVIPDSTVRSTLPDSSEF
ncbi:MAG: CdaR family protein [Longimicrobiales bacterium]